MNVKMIRKFALLATITAALALSQQKNPLDPLNFLLGTWSAPEAESQLGTARGGTTFKLDLDRHVIVRTNFAEYIKGPQAGTRHDDLMIIYADGSNARAIYFDSEGHTIRYRITVPAPNSAIFESEASDPGPRYRLTHRVHGDVFDGKFEIAPPGESNYKTYLSWQSKRIAQAP